MKNSEVFGYYQPFGNSDPAHTASAPSGITVATPAMTPLMLSGSALVAWNGTSAGTAVGVLAQNLTGGETRLNYYKTGSFRLEDIQWPAGVTDENKKTNGIRGHVSQRCLI